jgi:branched-chain amino acid transport system ATP-binding protein
MSFLEVSHLTTYYGNIAALKDISFYVEEGEIVTLIGSNGAGKTTTLNTLCGLTPARSGSIHLAGDAIEALPPHEIVRRGVIQSPEGRKIFARLSVLENLEMGAFTRRDPSGVKHDLADVLDRFPRLRERLHQLGGTLSGGEQQMLAIGRALMARPRLLLLDEPSMGLAPLFVRDVFQSLVQLNKNGTTILLVEQNAHMALMTAHRAYVLQTGQIVQSGDAQVLRKDRAIIRAYLGGT